MIHKLLVLNFLTKKELDEIKRIKSFIFCHSLHMIEAVRATSSYTGFLVKRSEHYCSNNLFSLDAIRIHLMLTPTVNQVPWEC